MAEDQPIEDQIISQEEIMELEKKEEMQKITELDKKEENSVAPKKKSIFRGLWWKIPVFFILLVILIIALLPVYSSVFISPIVSTLESATGNKVSIDSLSINVFASHITLKNFVMTEKNTESVVAKIELLDVDVSILALLMGKINIPTADIQGVYLNYELPEATTTTTTTTTTKTTETKTTVQYSKDNPVTVDLKLPEVYAHINVDNINVHITNASKTLNLQFDNFYFKCDVNTLKDIQYKSGSKNAISVAGFDSGFKYNFEGNINVDTSNKNVICTAKGEFRLDDLYAKKEGLVDISNHSIVFSHDISSNLNDASLTVADLSFNSKYAGMSIKDFKMQNGYEVLSLVNKVAEQAQAVMEQAKQDLQNVNVNSIDILNYEGLQGTVSYYLDLGGLYDDWGKFIAQVTNNLVKEFGGKIEMEGRWNQPSNFIIKIQPDIFVNGAFNYTSKGSIDLQGKGKQSLITSLSCNFADLQPFLRAILPDIQLQGKLDHKARLFLEKQAIVGEAKGNLTGFNMVLPNNGQTIACKLDPTSWNQKLSIVTDIKKPTIKLDTCDIQNPAFSMKSKGQIVYDSKKLLTEYNINFPIIDVPALMNVVSVSGTSNAVEPAPEQTQTTTQPTTEPTTKNDALLCLQQAHIDALKLIGLNFKLSITKLIIDASNTIQNFVIKSTLNKETTDNKCNVNITGKINDGTLSFNVDADCSVPHPDCAVSYNLNQIPYNIAMADMITNSFPLLKKISFSNDGKVALNMKGNYQWKGIDTRAILRSLVSKEDNTLSLPSGSLDFTADSDSLLGPINTVSNATEKLEKEIKKLEDTLSTITKSVKSAETALSVAKKTSLLGNKSLLTRAQQELDKVTKQKNDILSQLNAKKAELQKQTKNVVSPLNYSFDSLTVTFGIENDNPWTGIENQLNNHPYSKIVYKSINSDTVNKKFPKITGWTGFDGSYEFNINLSNITDLPVLNKGLIFSNNGVSLGK